MKEREREREREKRREKRKKTHFIASREDYVMEIFLSARESIKSLEAF